MTEERQDEHPAPAVTILPPEPPEPSARPQAAAAASTPPERFVTLMRWGLSLVVLALVLVALEPFWAPRLLPFWSGGTGGQDAAAQVKALQARLDADEAARRGAEARVASLEANAAALAALGARIDALERRPDPGADATAAIAQLRAELQQLSTRLDQFEARVGSIAAAAASDNTNRILGRAVAELRAALSGSGPFDGALAAVAALGHGDAEVEAALKPLAAAAATGIPSRELLAQRFAAETAPAIRAAATPRPQESSDWGEGILARIRSLVVIRRVDEDASASNDPALARAQAALREGDLAGAVAALKLLTGAPAQAASSWLDRAEQRLAAEHALDALARQIASRIVAAPASTGAN
jgi:hypothetical protein